MSKNNTAKLAEIQLQLDEALQMLKLVAENKRTCLEVEEWLQLNFPETSESSIVLSELLQNNKSK